MSGRIPVKDKSDLARDVHSSGIVNTNRSAYETAIKRARDAQRQRDEIREATREINELKNEMGEIKSLLMKLANTS
jgi:hypothetical protein|tara:strand:- start:4940 stop:5167 length:228 start_codon:yes stop_codon:yes gene_type:complete